MYLCLCNALTDRRLRQAAAASDAVRPSDVYAACGCRAQCGACVKAVLGLLRDAAASDTLASTQLHGAD